MTGEERPSLSVLLVDDNRLNVILMTEILSSAGYSVTVACDGHEAVEAAEKAVFDLALMDLQMPGMDGIETTRRIRALPRPHGAMPIIAITAGSFFFDRQKCLASGMDEYLTKPFRIEELHKIMDGLIRREAAEPPASPPDGLPDELPPPAPYSALMAKFEELQLTMGRDGALRMAGLFSDDAHAILRRLTAMVAAGPGGEEELHEMARQVHNLKASARLLGLAGLADAAAEFEKAVTAGQHREWPDRLADTARRLTAAEEELAIVANRSE